MIAQLLSQWFPTIAPILIAAFLAWKEIKKPTPPKASAEGEDADEETESLTEEFALDSPADMLCLQAVQALRKGDSANAQKCWDLALELKSAEAQTKK